MSNRKAEIEKGGPNREVAFFVRYSLSYSLKPTESWKFEFFALFIN